MNIFKALSQGNGSISETNITSFLSYLLNSSNELNNTFLLLLLSQVDLELEEGKINYLLGTNQSHLRDRMLYFSSRYEVSAVPEYRVKNGGTKRIIDVLLRVSEKGSGADVCCLLIENKIKREAKNRSQVSTQFNYFTGSTEFDQDIPVYSVLITTDSEAFLQMYLSAKQTNPKTVWLRWTNHIVRDNSIEGILRDIIKKEHESEIFPINPNTQFIIKSFIDYISSEYSHRRSSGVRNFSFNGFGVVSSASAMLFKQLYVIKRFENNMIRLFDENDELNDTIVRPVLDNIDQKYNLGINPRHSTGTKKNTQVFGKEVIDKLNSLVLKP